MHFLPQPAEASSFCDWLTFCAGIAINASWVVVATCANTFTVLGQLGWKTVGQTATQEHGCLAVTVHLTVHVYYIKNVYICILLWISSTLKLSSSDLSFFTQKLFAFMFRKISHKSGDLGSGWHSFGCCCGGCGGGCGRYFHGRPPKWFGALEQAKSLRSANGSCKPNYK